MDFDLSVRIEADRGVIFAVLADVQRYATGPDSPILTMEKTPSGETVVGTRWREVVRLGPLLHMTMWSEVTECVAGCRLQMDFHGGGMRGWLRYTLDEDGPGASTLRQEEHVDLRGPLRLLDAIAARLLERRLVTRLDEIRELVE